MKISTSVLAFLVTIVCIVSCTQKTSEPTEDARALRIDGSSTVYPITEHIIKKYKSKFNNLAISIGVSGTGGGFEKFSQNEVDINNASREIKAKEEVACDSNGVRYRSFEVAYDGIAVVVNQENTWANELTTEELKSVWMADGAVNWSDIRPDWPEQPIKRYGPGEASGTHDYFKEAILDDAEITDDYTKSENDNLLAKGVSSNEFSIGFFGLAYFKEYQNELKLVAVDNGQGAIFPNDQTVTSGSYAPLARAMYIYVNEEFAELPEGKEFVKFYLENAASAAEAVGYVSLPSSLYEASVLSLQ